MCIYFRGILNQVFVGGKRSLIAAAILNRRSRARQRQSRARFEIRKVTVRFLFFLNVNFVRTVSVSFYVNNEQIKEIVLKNNCEKVIF